MKRLLFVGLGNPGDTYAGTRHNAGIDALRAWVDGHDSSAHWREESKHEAIVTHVQIGDIRIDCMFPTTFMNESGRAVQSYMQFYDISPEVLVVVHDELEISLGEVVVKQAGSAHGHNGIRSIQTSIATDEFTRVRIGIGRPAEDIPVQQYVLQKFSQEERLILRDQSFQHVCKLLDVFVAER